jgi:uncharacterized protein YdeI (YjbR/CyaY-like superfamily)
LTLSKSDQANDRLTETHLNPLFFAKSSEFHAWLEKHHDKTQEIWVGFHKIVSGKPSITWPESVDEALCFGWIDGVRKSVSDTSYTIRFTKRTTRSVWSAVNIKRAEELIDLGRMQPAGLKVFEQRTDERSAIYSYEQRQSARLSGAFEKQFRANKKAWDFFRAQAPLYQRVAAFWVVSAKKDETKLKRLAKLIEDSENGRTIPPLTRRPKRE